MAIGDAAAAAGMELVPSAGTGESGKVKFGWREFNRTRDYIAQFFTASKAYADSLFAGISLTWGAISGKPSIFPSDWGSVAGKPGSFPPSAHGHVSAEVTHYGNPVQTVLDGLSLGQLNPGVYGRNITWTRRAVWIGDNGELGYASSKRATKQNFEAPDWTVEQLMSVPILHYRYRAAVYRERAGGRHAAVEIGTIADDLHTLGLWEFVIYEDGKPEGVHYELLGLAALWLAQEAMRRVLLLEARDA